MGTSDQANSHPCSFLPPPALHTDTTNPSKTPLVINEFVFLFFVFYDTQGNRHYNIIAEALKEIFSIMSNMVIRFLAES